MIAKSEACIVIDGKKDDAAIHNHIMAGVQESAEYHLTSYRAARAAGVDKAVAMALYLKDEDHSIAPLSDLH
jgi:hypothetical protein